MGNKSLTMDEILENLPSPVLIVRHHTVIYGNQSFWEFYLPEETQDYPMPTKTPNIDIYQLVKHNSRGPLREYLISLSSLERPFETILISADKEYTPVLISGRCLNPSYPPEERIHLLVCADISAKLKNEFLLYEMLEEIDEIFFVISVDDYSLQYINKRGLMLLRMNEDDLKGRKYVDVFPELQWPHLANLIDLAIRNMMPLHDKEIYARRTNGSRVYLSNFIPIHDFNRTYSLLLVTLKEITKFQSKISLANQLERIIQSIPDPMLIIDKRLEFRLINNAAIELRGINPLHIRDSSIVQCSEIFQRASCGTENCPMLRLLNKNETIKDLEVEIYDNVGQLRTFLLTIIPLEMIQGQTFYLMRFSDITAKKDYEKELTIYQAKLKEENLKLQNQISQMTITPVHESSAPTLDAKVLTAKSNQLQVNFEPGNSYLYTEQNHEWCYQAFINEVHSGKLGLVISRIHPDKIREQYALKETPIVWVNNSVVDEAKRYVQPNLQFLLHLIKNFLKETSTKEEKSVILIDCLEYLTIYNDFKKIIQFYEVLGENIILYNGIAIFNIDPDAFESKEVALLRRGSTVIHDPNA